MSLEVVVLGTCGGYPAAGRACPGFLLRHDDENLVLDLGSGALANLLEFIDADQVGTVALSHMHYDHYVDIFGLCTARRFWEVQLDPLAAFAPAGAREIIGAPLSEESRPRFFECMELQEMSGDVSIEVGGFAITAKYGVHNVDSYIYRVEVGGRSVCYSGDTDLCDALLEQARGCDLFICEATFTSEVEAKMPGHMRASEAGHAAQEAGVKKLLLTHVWPTLSRSRAIADAAEEYSGPVSAADERALLDV